MASICSWATFTSSVGPSRVILSSPSVNSMWTYRTKTRVGPPGWHGHSNLLCEPGLLSRGSSRSTDTRRSWKGGLGMTTVLVLNTVWEPQRPPHCAPPKPLAWSTSTPHCSRPPPCAGGGVRQTTTGVKRHHHCPNTPGEKQRMGSATREAGATEPAPPWEPGL